MKGTKPKDKELRDLKFGEDIYISEDILSLGKTLPHYTKEEMAGDERLIYLLSKNCQIRQS